MDPKYVRHSAVTSAFGWPGRLIEGYDFLTDLQWLGLCAGEAH